MPREPFFGAYSLSGRIHAHPGRFNVLSSPPIKHRCLMSQTLQEFLGIQWPSRSAKPRKEGLTMVMDTGWPTSFN